MCPSLQVGAPAVQFQTRSRTRAQGVGCELARQGPLTPGRVPPDLDGFKALSGRRTPASFRRADWMA